MCLKLEYIVNPLSFYLNSGLFIEPTKLESRLQEVPSIIHSELRCMSKNKEFRTLIRN